MYSNDIECVLGSNKDRLSAQVEPPAVTLGLRSESAPELAASGLAPDDFNEDLLAHSVRPGVLRGVPRGFR